MPDIPSRTMLDESLSALMDGETQEMELRRLLQQMPMDPALRARWARYQLVSAAMHRQPCVCGVSPGFADAVHAAIQKETSVVTNLPEEGAWQMTRRFAVAASVALAVVVGVQWQQNNSGNVGGGEGQLVAVPSAATPVGTLASGSGVTMMQASQPLTGNLFEQAKDMQGGRYMQRNLEQVSLEAGKNRVPLAPAVVLPSHNKQ